MSIKNSQSGFSIIEIMVSLSIILVMFDLCVLQANALKVIQKQRYEDVAYQVANKQMETLRATSFDFLPASGTISDSTLSQVPSGVGSFTVSDYGAYSGVKEMVVTITWNDGANKSLTIKTLAQNGGLNP